MKTPKQNSNSMRNNLEDYTMDLSLSKSALTVDAYKRDINKMIDYLEGKNVKRAKSLKSEHIVSFLGHCKAAGKSDASVNRYYMSIRSFCKYLRRTKHITEDLTEDITTPRNQQKAPRIPTITEINKILEQPNTGTESGMRDKAILELLYSSGLRASELCNVMLQDESGKQIRVTCGKRGKTRTVPITKTAEYWIAQYLENHRGCESGYLFQTCAGKKIHRGFLYLMVTNYAAKAGIEGVTTHTLRHACATHLLDQGADLRLIQEVLGHSSIASTQRYTHLSSTKMQEMFQTFHPRRDSP